MKGSRPPGGRATEAPFARIVEATPTRQDSATRLRSADTSAVAQDSDSLPRIETPRFVSGPVAILPASLNKVGPYRLLSELASGGMATVYLGLRRGVFGFEKFVAVKCIHAHLIHDEQFWEMFVDEARIAASVSHPYVCSVFDFGRAGSGYYMAMEFLQGEPLSRFLAKTLNDPKILDDARYPRLIARVGANLAEGLHAIHSIRDEAGTELGVVHRDVSPQNLFVLFDGTVRVTDLGIAYAKKRLHHTPRHAIKGKVAYLAPEVLEREAFDRRADVWSLGVVLWELLAGRRLFRSASEGETVMAVISRTVPPPSAFNGNIPKQLDEIVLRALHRDKNQRFSNAREMSRALEQFLSQARDTVPAMDVAAWVYTSFPHGLEECQRLVEHARELAGTLPESEPYLSVAPESDSDITRTRVEIPSMPLTPRVESLALPEATTTIATSRVALMVAFVFAVVATLTFVLVRLFFN